MPLDLVTVPCLQDNYVYLLHDAATGATAVIDVPEAAPVLAALASHGWTLTDILITHHHWDHIEGVEAVRAATGARVVGAAADAHRLPPLDLAVVEGDAVRLGSEVGLVLDVSGHTVGHIAYHFPTSHIVCSGDSLMALGCGRLLEGSAAQMWDSLCKFAEMPEDTLVCSGHEYSANNAKFALTIEPGNAELISRFDEIAALRAQGQPTVPSRLGLERATNPFLRADLATVKALIGLPHASDAEAFAEIRRRKDRF